MHSHQVAVAECSDTSRHDENKDAERLKHGSRHFVFPQPKPRRYGPPEASTSATHLIPSQRLYPEEGLQPVAAAASEEGLQPVAAAASTEGLQPVAAAASTEGLQPVAAAASTTDCGSTLRTATSRTCIGSACRTSKRKPWYSHTKPGSGTRPASCISKPATVS